MKIQFELWGGCTSNTCAYRKECAQHTSAGDFRAEDGFRPEVVGDECFTVDRPVYHGDPIYGIFPDNIGDLDRGMIPARDFPMNTKLPSKEEKLRRQILNLLREYEDGSEDKVGCEIAFDSGTFIFDGQQWKK